jgi:alginate O-acetyltransferase complex protein AlgI
MSLSSWLRDYVYIPLGGSRAAPMRVSANLIATMVLGGLWHGAAWHFVAWGLLWGVALVCHRGAQTTMRRFGIRLPTGFAWLITQLVVVLGWVLFRADSLVTATGIWRSLLTPVADTRLISAGEGVFVLGSAILLLLWQLTSRARWRPSVRPGLRPVLLGVLLAACVAYAVIAAPPPAQRFIYFQF